MPTPILSQIFENRATEFSLPSALYDMNIGTFSHSMSLYDYQQDALMSAIQLLLYYYDHGDSFEGQKKDLARRYRNLQDADTLLKEEFLNRAGFWMATGSGKTLVMIKLIHILHILMRKGYIPVRPLLMLAPRAEILDQIHSHIHEFNTNGSIRITSHDLKRDLNDIRVRQQRMPNAGEAPVYIYRSDLISDHDGIAKKKKDRGKKIDYQSIANSGKWYIILDEAHKGDAEESKRQRYYRELTAQGFLFNFSATFTDPIDIATTLYNFNLERFISSGYGKKIKIADEEFRGFNKHSKDEWEDTDKKDVILKTLILFSAIKKAREDNIGKQFYHNPLMVCVAGTVNTKNADLKLFFKVINELAAHKHDITDYADAISDTLASKESSQFSTEGSPHMSAHTISAIAKITYEDILQYFFNAPGTGSIEYYQIQGNTNQIAFQLTNADAPFALLNIGNATKWEGLLKELALLRNDEILTQDFFKEISMPDSPINMLMGSRIFAEGWDSNRPNIISFFNIGSREAKKYVLQTIGRGVRIEPQTSIRKRYAYMDIEAQPFDKNNNDIAAAVELLETLFVFATSKEGVCAIMSQLDEQITEHTLGNLFQKSRSNMPRLLPRYTKDKEYTKEPYPVNIESYRQLHAIHETFSRKVIAMRALGSAVTDDIVLNTLAKCEGSNMDERYFVQGGETVDIVGHECAYLIMLHTFFTSKKEVLSGFYEADQEKESIQHYRRISIRVDNNISELDIENLRKLIQQWVAGNPSQRRDKIDTEIRQLDIHFGSKRISQEEYEKKRDTLDKNRQELRDIHSTNLVNLRHIGEHYYLPLALKNEKSKAVLRYIINEQSEIDFIDKLEEYTARPSNKLRALQWSFSKIEEHTDKEVYIPYFDTKNGSYRRFYPDFIFWIKKEAEYHIVFLDPKGLEHERASRDKAKGFEGFARSVSDTRDAHMPTQVHLWFYSEAKITTVGTELAPYVSADFDEIFGV